MPAFFIGHGNERDEAGMAENSIIEWTRSTFNPWIGCTRISPGCDGCYAAISTPARSMKIEWGAGKPRHRTSASTWAQVRRWNAKAGEAGEFWPVFTASLADVFDNEVPDDWREEFWALVRACPHLTFQMVTKRIGNVPRMLPADWGDRGYPNVWLLITVVNQEEADRDIPKLLRVPARIHGLSMEPLLGPVDLRMRPASGSGQPRIDWVISGGESGAAARAPHPDWIRSLRDQCQAAGAAFFFKRWGEWRPAAADADAAPARQAHAFDDGSVSVRIGKKSSGRELDGCRPPESGRGAPASQPFLRHALMKVLRSSPFLPLASALQVFILSCCAFCASLTFGLPLRHALMNSLRSSPFLPLASLLQALILFC
jgi:protein gp37